MNSTAEILTISHYLHQKCSEDFGAFMENEKEV